MKEREQDKCQISKLFYLVFVISRQKVKIKTGKLAPKGMPLLTIAANQSIIGIGVKAVQNIRACSIILTATMV